MSEFWDLEDLALLVFGMMYLLLFLFLLLVVVCGRAVVVRCAHVHVACMFARARSIGGYTSGPAHAITGACSVQILQGFVFDVWIGV